MKAKLVLLISTVGLVLSGCNTAPSSEFLTGGWVPEPGSCDSGGVFQFLADGTWSTEGASGSWSLMDNQLKMTTTYSLDDDGNPVAEPVDFLIPIESIGTDFFIEAAQDKTPKTKWKRCAASEAQDADRSPQKEVEAPPPEPSSDTSESGLFAGSEQKIIWEWTGGYNWVNGWNSTWMRSECPKYSESLKSYTSDGWKIISSSPNKRTVTGGTCDGRDIVIER